MTLAIISLVFSLITFVYAVVIPMYMTNKHKKEFEAIERQLDEAIDKTMKAIVQNEANKIGTIN